MSNLFFCVAYLRLFLNCKNKNTILHEERQKSHKSLGIDYWFDRSSYGTYQLHSEWRFARTSAYVLQIDRPIWFEDADITMPISRWFNAWNDNVISPIPLSLAGLQEPMKGCMSDVAMNTFLAASLSILNSACRTAVQRPSSLIRLTPFASKWISINTCASHSAFYLGLEP
jgi:hypothetical protein